MCQSCQAARINGLLCHETGCPECWRDGLRECLECGTEFTPEDRDHRFCSPCCAAAWYGTECDCDDCRAIYSQSCEPEDWDADSGL